MRTGTHPRIKWEDMAPLENATVLLFLGRARLVLGSIVNAAANGKRLRVIDAFGDLE